jgi:excisionase family DNA binding protein
MPNAAEANRASGAGEPFIERRQGPPRRRWDDALPAAHLPEAQVALTVKQVAELLGMTPKAVYHRAERGQLPGKFFVGKSIRFRRADLLRSMAEGRGLSPTRSR